MEKKIDKVSIEIKQATFSILRLLPNKIWNILAEYVDNSLSSYRIEKQELKKYGNTRLIVKIDITDKYIKIHDNAGGINSTEFERALELANLPKNKTELNEFGMGMKTSSIWLGDIWTLKSAAINETMERTVEFDLNKVVDNNIKSLNVTTVKKQKNVHFTEITIKQLSENSPSSYQFDKIRDHLSSIYRIPIRTGEMQIIFNGKILEYEDQKILRAPFIKSPNEIAIEWKYPIDFPLGKYHIKGFIGILEKMSNNLSGLSLFKKGRVIQGSHDEKYKPTVLFGKDPGSALYKGLFGELELTGFDVTYNKGTFRDVDSLDRVMIEIKKILSNPKNNFIAQATEYSRQNSKHNIAKAAKSIVANIEKARKKAPLKDKLKAIDQSNLDKAKSKANREQFRKAKSITPELKGDLIEFRGKKINLKMFLINSPNVDDLFSIFDEGTKKGINEIHYKINLAHPFFSKYSNVFKNKYEPIVDLIEAFVIAEINTSTVVKFGDKIRDTFNNYLKNIN
jgi:hypothetical protein